MAWSDYVVRLEAEDDITPTAKKAAAALDALPESVDVEIEASGIDKALGAMRRLQDEAEQVERIADKLRQALGPELAAKADLRQVIAGFERAGASLDELEAKASEVGTELRGLAGADGAGLEQISSRARAAATGTGELTDAARGANSALANMVGNTGQELGELVGVAGAAGVAVGQMAEYFSDATLGGQQFRSAIADMAKVIGPIAAIALATQVLNSYMQTQAQRAEEAADRTRLLGDAMESAADDSVGLADALRDNVDALREFEATDILGPVNWVNDIAKAIPLVGRFAQDVQVDLVGALTKAGESMYSFSDAITGTTAEAQAFLDGLYAQFQAGKITGDEYEALTQAIVAYRKAQQSAAQAQRLFNVSAEEANAVLQELAAKADPLAQMADTWAVLFEDMRDGSIDSKAAADAVNELAEALGLTQEEVIAIAREHLADEFEAQADAAKAAAEAAAEYAVALSNAQGAVSELVDSLDDIRGASIADVFDLSNRPEADAGRIRDIGKAIGELPKALEGVSVGDVLSNSLNADGFLDEIDGLRDRIQERMADAFAAGDTQGAKNIAETYIRQITESLGGAFTGQQVADLLGLGDLQAQVDVAIKQSALETARRSLDLLVGLGGENTLTASIALALEAGSITPAGAQQLINQQLTGAGVEVPAELRINDMGQATVEAATFLRDHPVPVTTTADTSGALEGLADLSAAEIPPAELGVEADTSQASKDVDGLRSGINNATPAVVPTDADTKKAVLTMLLLYGIAQALKPVVSVQADTSAAQTSIANLMNQTRVIRIPVDTYLRTDVRVTGMREP